MPAPVSEKKVLKESSPPPTVLSEGICPSGWIPVINQLIRLGNMFSGEAIIGNVKEEEREGLMIWVFVTMEKGGG